QQRPDHRHGEHGGRDDERRRDHRDDGERQPDGEQRRNGGGGGGPLVGRARGRHTPHHRAGAGNHPPTPPPPRRPPAPRRARLALGGGTVTAGTGGRVTLRGDAAGRAIDLGSTVDTNNALELSDAELDTISTTGVIQVGEATAGAITISQAISIVASTPVLSLQSASTVTESGGSITLTGGSDPARRAGQA